MKIIINTALKAALIMVAAFGLAACGGSDGPTQFDTVNPPQATPAPEPEPTDPEPVVVSLEINDEFEILAGDELRPDGEAEVEFRVNAETGARFVTLISGTAEVERAPE
ncbi:hypothetical protein CWE08_03075 [Aliidiomarina iranensis]|uniref:Uncharacterized protein n=1 Tax=Aliidiomarina iranensis TaxID=1434071 RepID=A0A432W366_9GAMM|nr:hypothetical protein [Aliidiomarina iranensis]RUO23644.1 hypothetical protein CWE08_03075 [Aliidiomarina iranensis]